MLKRYFFINPFSSTRFLFFLFVLMLFSMNCFLFIMFILCGSLYLFRKKDRDFSAIQSIDSSVLLSPCDGRVEKVASSEKINEITLKLGCFQHYGLCMPLSGEIESFFETHESRMKIGGFDFFHYRVVIVMKSSELGAIKIKFKSLASIAKPKIWCLSGDRGSIGSYFGYLPFGGKIVIQVPKNLDILVNLGDKIQSAQTLLAAKESK